MRWLSRRATAAPPPAPFILFSFGITRSGSTLGFEIARAALEQAGAPQPEPGKGDTLFIPGTKRPQIRRLTEMTTQTGGPIVAKLHNAPEEAARRALRKGAAKAHIMLRDPRDVALSLVDAGARARQAGGGAFSEVHTLADAKASIDKQMPMLLGWLQQPGGLCLSYPDLAFDTEATIKRILTHLDIDGDPNRILRAVRKRGKAKPLTAQRDRFLQAMSAADQDWFAAAYAPFYDHVLGQSQPDVAHLDSLQSADCTTMITPPSESETT